MIEPNLTDFFPYTTEPLSAIAQKQSGNVTHNAKVKFCHHVRKLIAIAESPVLPEDWVKDRESLANYQLADGLAAASLVECRRLNGRADRTDILTHAVMSLEVFTPHRALRIRQLGSAIQMVRWHEKPPEVRESNFPERYGPFTSEPKLYDVTILPDDPWHQPEQTIAGRDLIQCANQFMAQLIQSRNSAL